MTFKQFLQKLAAAKVRWHVSQNVVKLDHEQIRGEVADPAEEFGEQYVCPITAVARVVTGARFRVYSWRDAARVIGLPIDLAEKIAYAADYPNYDFGKLRAVRRLLLKTVGLTPAQEVPIATDRID